MKDTQPTQQFVEIEDIKNGVVVLKNGGLRRVLMVAGINFELKSEEEQASLLAAYQNFLNSLDFSVQIIIHSRKLNIEAYLDSIEQRREEEDNDLLRNQIDEYLKFIKSFIETNDVMMKTFFVVVPYDAISLKKGMVSIADALPFFSKKESKEEKQQSFDEMVSQLDQRTEQVLAGLENVGLRVVVLNDEELIELFYNLYNPQPIEKKDLKIAKK